MAVHVKQTLMWTALSANTVVLAQSSENGIAIAVPIVFIVLLIIGIILGCIRLWLRCHLLQNRAYSYGPGRASHYSGNTTVIHSGPTTSPPLPMSNFTQPQAKGVTPAQDPQAKTQDDHQTHPATAPEFHVPEGGEAVTLPTAPAEMTQAPPPPYNTAIKDSSLTL